MVTKNLKFTFDTRYSMDFELVDYFNFLKKISIICGFTKGRDECVLLQCLETFIGILFIYESC